MSDKPPKLVFLDLETTGLDPRKHEILEVGLIKRTDAKPGADLSVHFSLPIDEQLASEKALEVNRYDERRDELKVIEVAEPFAARILYGNLRDAIVIGNNVQFDLRFIEQFLIDNPFEVTGIGYDYTPTPWNYHPVDLKAFVAGRLGMGPPPWSTKDIADQAQVPLTKDAHSAWADAAWNRDVYDAVMNYEQTYLPNGSVNPPPNPLNRTVVDMSDYGRY